MQRFLRAAFNKICTHPDFGMLSLFAAVEAVFTVEVAGAGREEIVSGEFNLSENIAGLVCGIIALFFGYAEIVYRHKHLNVSD